MKLFLRGSFAAALLFAVSLPVAAAPTDVRNEAPVWRYTVKPGDKLINIASRYFLRPEQWAKIQQTNNVVDPQRLLPGTVLRIPVSMLRKTPGEARLESVSGSVRWRAVDGDWQTATDGQRLVAGVSLETLENSSVVLVLADGSRIVVSPASQITLDTLSLYAGGLMADTRLRLQHGQTDIFANPEKRGGQSLKIQTPSAQAVVRGTHFRVGASAALTREETVSGLVSVDGAGKAVRVAQGKGTVAKAGAAPMPPVPLLKAADVAGLPKQFEHLPLRFPLPAVAGAVEWQGQIAPDNAFERVLLEKTARGAALSFADLPNGNYVLRLRGIDANGLHGLDALHPFTVFARPFPPGLNSPGDSATIRAARHTFAWGNVVDSVRYRLQISRVADFSALLHDESLVGESWQVPQELPEGQLFWRAASVTENGQQGPWSVPAAFVYKPGPGAADLGKAALQIESEKIALRLPPPPDGLDYEALLSSEKTMEPVLAQTRSADGALDLPRPPSGSYYLGVRLVDRSDNTPGPVSAQKIEIPPSRLWLLLLLVPFAL